MHHPNEISHLGYTASEGKRLCPKMSGSCCVCTRLGNNTCQYRSNHHYQKRVSDTSASKRRDIQHFQLAINTKSSLECPASAKLLLNRSPSMEIFRTDSASKPPLKRIPSNELIGVVSVMPVQQRFVRVTPVLLIQERTIRMDNISETAAALQHNKPPATKKVNSRQQSPQQPLLTNSQEPIHPMKLRHLLSSYHLLELSR